MPTFINHQNQLQSEDTRNIDEKYRWWDHSRIVEALDETRSELVTIFHNVHGDFNVSSGIRVNLWFNTSGVYIYGNKKYDRRGTVGAHHYVPVDHAPNLKEVIDGFREKGYRIVAAEITDDAVSLPSYQWDEKSVVIFGEETNGLEQETLDMVDDIVFIPGRGSIRSLNVATASGIFMYDYSAKTGIIS